MDDINDDARSVATTSSELNPNTPFTQEEIDGVRGFVQVTRAIGDHKKTYRGLQKELKKHKEILLNLLKTRGKTKLKLDENLKVQLVTSTVQKKPPASQVFEMIQSTLREESREVYSRIFPKFESTMKASETAVEKEKLVLEEPQKKKKST